MDVPANSQRVRTQSLSILEGKGLRIPVHFPFLEEMEYTRNKDDILARLGVGPVFAQNARATARSRGDR